ncbi:hypothetical protein HPB49_012169 [Dermacentor silvarum]|uniref:Uncharacterized protein n=1 Tax=Dermacentor silvarum TaxID=543639 RepID=A0ACB8CR99_DERSI|nr:hypothetical protein HPB49_012169 [Dermacentor silvarum]
MSGNLGLKDTWSFLRFLLDPGHTKAAQRKNVTRILHQLPLKDDALLQAIKDQYLTTSTPILLPSYTGAPNPALGYIFQQVQDDKCAAQKQPVLHAKQGD